MIKRPQAATGNRLDNGIRNGISNIGRLSLISIGGCYECMDSKGTDGLLCEV